MNIQKVIKTLILAVSAALIAKSVHGKKGAALPSESSKVIKDKTPDFVKSLEPIAKTYWLLHPKKALTLYLYQKAFAFTWMLAKKYFKD